jgi:hypothetical protein
MLYLNTKKTDIDLHGVNNIKMVIESVGYWLDAADPKQSPMVSLYKHTKPWDSIKMRVSILDGLLLNSIQELYSMNVVG